jgi:hypothetical protein
MRSFHLTLFAALVLATAVSSPLVARSISGASSFVFEITLQSSKSGIAQIFYDVGRGMRKEDSGSVEIAKSDAPATYRFQLPSGEYRALRFDPID